MATLENYSNVRRMGTIPNKRINYERNFSPKVLDIDWERKIVIMVEQGCLLQFMNMNLELINEIEMEVESINLCKSIDLLLIGSSKGRIYLCRWPDISHRTYMSDVEDNIVIGINDIHENKIVAVRLSLNYRFIFTISESG